jgi:hypothetical protein
MLDTKETVKQVEEQFNFWPKKISEMIGSLFPPVSAYPLTTNEYYREYFEDNITKKLCEFHAVTTERYDEAGKKHGVNCTYALPDRVEKKIFAQNKKDFITCWNFVLKFISEEMRKDHRHIINYHHKMNLLYLAVRSSLVMDYGYFDKVQIKKLFKIE